MYNKFKGQICFEYYLLQYIATLKELHISKILSHANVQLIFQSVWQRACYYFHMSNGATVTESVNGLSRFIQSIRKCLPLHS